MASDVKHLFMCLFAICIFSSLNFIFYAHFLTGFSFFTADFRSFKNMYSRYQSLICGLQIFFSFSFY